MTVADLCIEVARHLVDREDGQRFMESSTLHRDAMIAGGFIRGIDIDEDPEQLSRFPKLATLQRMRVKRSMQPSHVLVMFQSWTSMKDRFKEVTDLEISFRFPDEVVESECSVMSNGKLVRLLPTLFPKLLRLTLGINTWYGWSVNIEQNTLRAISDTFQNRLLDLRLILPTCPLRNSVQNMLSSLTSLTVESRLTLTPDQWLTLAQHRNLRHVAAFALQASPNWKQQMQSQPCLWETLRVDHLESLLSDPLHLPLHDGVRLHLMGDSFEVKFDPHMHDDRIRMNCSALAGCLQNAPLPLILKGAGNEGQIRAMAPLFARTDLFASSERDCQLSFEASFLRGYNLGELIEVFPSIVALKFHHCIIHDDVWDSLLDMCGRNLQIIEFTFMPDDAFCNSIRRMLVFFAKSIPMQSASHDVIIRLDRGRMGDLDSKEEECFDNNVVLAELFDYTNM